MIFCNGNGSKRAVVLVKHRDLSINFAETADALFSPMLSVTVLDMVPGVLRSHLWENSALGSEDSRILRGPLSPHLGARPTTQGAVSDGSQGSPDRRHQLYSLWAARAEVAAVVGK